MTVREYIDSVKLRLQRIGITRTLNDALILNYINKARRNVQVETLGLFESRYGRRDVFQLNNIALDQDDSNTHLYYQDTQINVVRFPLPVDYIDIATLWLVRQDQNGFVYREARKVNKREFFNVRSHCFNMPTSDRPIYAIETKQFDVRGSGGNICYLSAGATDISNASVEIYAVVALQDFDQWDEQELVLSPDLEEYAVKQAVLYCLNDVEYLEIKDILLAELNEYKNMLMTNYKISKDQPIEILPSQEAP